MSTHHRRWLLSAAILCGVGLMGASARAQISSKQIRDRYNKNTKGSSIDDYVRNLNSEDANKRLEAVKSLGAAKDNKAIEYLIQALGDPDVRVQAKAINVLGDLRATDATPVLVQYLFLVTTDNSMKQMILAALGKIGDPRAARPIMEFLHRDLDPPTRGTAIFALGDIGSPESVDTLTQISQSEKDDTLRRLATEAVAKVEQHQAIKRNEAKAPADNFLKAKDEPPPQQ